MRINRDTMISELETLLRCIFKASEVEQVQVGDIVIRREDALPEKTVEAIAVSYHDAYSDVDMILTIRLPDCSSQKCQAYMQYTERFGLTDETLLGRMINVEKNVCRICTKAGMRYDMIFRFVEDAKAVAEPGPSSRSEEEEDAFWFIQIQALGKLYRRDYLISDHLANINLNTTLVQQMILRDRAHGTNHHRYGYQEKLVYLKYEWPGHTGDTVFDLISNKLYRAAMAYDALKLQLNPEARSRKNDFLRIWQCYEKNRTET